MSLRSVLNDPDDVVVDILDLAILPDRGLDVLQNLDPGQRIHKAGHPPVLHAADPPNAAHAVDVVCGVQGEVVVNNVTATIFLLKLN